MQNTVNAPHEILFIAPAPWAALMQRHQAFASGLAKAGWNVIYLDPLRSGGWSYVEDRPIPRLRRISMKIPFRAAQNFNLQKIAVKIAWHRLFKEGIQPAGTALWISDPSFAEIIKLNWHFKIYDRCDRHGFFPCQKIETWHKYENLIYRHADLVFASSPILAQEAAQGKADNVFLISNAADFTWRSKPISTRPSGPPWKLVSAGAHFEWIDYSWLKNLALIPGVELHIAGPGRGEGWQNLIASPNVVLHGVLEHNKLYNLFDSCHIGLIPFCDNELVLGVDPIKAYEYAARGLAVWAPKIEVLKRHPLVTRTLSAEEASLYLASDASTTPVLKAVETWDDRLAEIFKIFQKAGIKQ